MSETFDDVVIGAGAAGLFYAGVAGKMGRRVLVLDHAKKPAEKVRISGGGRCNFTNIHTAPDRFISRNKHFAKSALARYTPQDFCDLMSAHGLTWHEKTLGQLFCDQKSGAVIDMLIAEMRAGGGALRLETRVSDVSPDGGAWRVESSGGPVSCERMIVATGGPSIPKIGATGFAYDLARRFGHAIIEPVAALVPFTFEGADKDRFAQISGVACDVRASAGGAAFDEAMLFTHRGLSGPAMLQTSSYWNPGEAVTVDLFAGDDGAKQLKALKAGHPMKTLASALEAIWPRRLVEMLSEAGALPEVRLADASHTILEETAAAFSAWALKPAGTEGWRTAEVARGGVATDALSSKTMESRHAPGLYFIGECVDVTGWLGGYNFQWAWASAYAAATA
ncbi:MAG: NAD(P)/FAD-dependent oxidoreductase [Oceanicaulis sp.]